MAKEQVSDRPTRLLWIDLEMTGLRPLKDKITEVGIIITDFDLKELASYGATIKHSDSELKKLYKGSDWHSAQPEYTEKLIQANRHGKSEDTVQTEIIRLIEEHIGLQKKPHEYPHFPGSLEAKGEVYLAGSSIAADRAFIDANWPKVARVLHYRMLDVSSFKLWMRGNKNLPRLENKIMSHRAIDDVRESINEMRYYSENM